MKCKKKHHTSICEEKQENPTQSSSYQMKGNRNSNSSQSPTNTIAKNTTHMGATHSLHRTNHILMQSAITKIRAGKQYRQARILFDMGSQRTFITQDMGKSEEQFPKKTCRSSVGRLSADRFWLKYEAAVDQQSADRRPTVGDVLVICR